MGHIYRFLRLPITERWLLIEAAFLLEAIKLGMRLLPFRTLRRLLVRASKVSERLPVSRSPSADSVGWAVEVASRYTFGVKTCLTEALVTQLLLARCGRSALLHIGVLKGDQNQLQAHAWVESEGRVVIGGGSKLERYTPLVVLKERGTLQTAWNHNFD